MSQEILNEDAYKQVFSSKEMRDTALQCALDIRKFEIELYWKRTAYFWTLIAAAFAGYFLLESKESPTLQPYVFLDSCIGLVLSVSWYLVNRGSKYWQENWERHVDVLEEESMGPLYKTTIHVSEFPWLNIFSGYPYSVSKINQIVSVYVIAVWLGAAFLSFPLVRCWTFNRPFGVYTLVGLTAFTILLLLLSGRSKSQAKRRPVNFYKTDLKSGVD